MWCPRGPVPGPSELSAALADQLPEYMIPSAFVVLDRLPLTPNGKVDRGALPKPGESRGAEGFVAPRNPLEEALAGIWREVLGIARVGVTEDFFDLGGHSLLATQAIVRIRNVLQVQLPLRPPLRGPDGRRAGGGDRRYAEGGIGQPRGRRDPRRARGVIR